MSPARARIGQEILSVPGFSESRRGSGDGDLESGRGSGSPHPVQRSRLAQYATVKFTRPQRVQFT